MAPASRSGFSGPLTWIALVLAVAGVAASAYLTYEHFTGSTTLACSESGKVNCLKVTTSEYATFLGVPVALAGLIFFVVVAAVMTPPAWRTPQPWVRVLRWVLVGGGVVFVLYLVWAELYEVGSICLWCSAVHVITVLLLLTVLFAEALREE